MRGRRVRRARLIVFRWVEHTAELELQIDAASRESLFADALEAFEELVGGDPAGDATRHEVFVLAEGPDPASLLVEWIEELVFLAETEDFVPERLVTLELGDSELRAEVEGRRGRPAHLVKAVTYHRLAVEERDDGWHATVVLDV
jgi:SHS2 domain-containing protein